MSIKKIRDWSVASTLAAGWMIFAVLMFLINWRVGARLIPLFLIGIFVYLAYMTVYVWPNNKKEEQSPSEPNTEAETQTTKKRRTK